MSPLRIRIRRSAVPAVALVCALVAPAGAADLPAALTAHPLACYQSYADYAPNGRFDHYGSSTAWTVDLPPGQGTYTATGDGIRGATSGRVRLRSGRLIFTSGPFHNRARRWMLTGRFVAAGARMPHDPRRGRRFPLVLRSTIRRPAPLAPPRVEDRPDVPVSFFYCR